MTREQLQRVPRAVGISGSQRRLPAIEAALKGGWINVLITDRFTAARLLQPPRPPPTPAAHGVDLEAVPQSQVRL